MQWRQGGDKWWWRKCTCAKAKPQLGKCEVSRFKRRVLDHYYTTWWCTLRCCRCAWHAVNQGYGGLIRRGQQQGEVGGRVTENNWSLGQRRVIYMASQ